MWGGWSNRRATFSSKSLFKDLERSIGRNGIQYSSLCHILLWVRHVASPWFISSPELTKQVPTPERNSCVFTWRPTQCIVQYLYMTRCSALILCSICAHYYLPIIWDFSDLAGLFLMRVEFDTLKPSEKNAQRRLHLYEGSKEFQMERDKIGQRRDWISVEVSASFGRVNYEQMFCNLAY